MKTFEGFIEDFNIPQDKEWFPYSCKFKRKKFERKDRYDNAKIFKVMSIDFKERKLKGYHSSTPKGFVRGPYDDYDSWNDNPIWVDFEEVEIFPYKECDCPICIEKLSRKYNL